MTKQPDYSHLIGEAKKAVESVEANFKIPAFTAILTHLLDGEGNVSSTHTNQRTTKKIKNDSIKKEKVGPRSWIRELVDENYFEQPRNSKNILEKLDERGHTLTHHDLTAPLAALVREQLLRRRKMVPKGEKKSAVHWVNW